MQKLDTSNELKVTYVQAIPNQIELKIQRLVNNNRDIV